MRCWDLLVFVVLKTTVLETLRGVLFGGHASSLLGLLGIVPEESRIGQALRESSEVAVPAFLMFCFLALFAARRCAPTSIPPR
jgi:hypothetical protein